VSGGRGPGRPRDEQAKRAIHEAALDLLVAHGYGKLTIDGIARRAGVGRQTVYRWWPGKADVVLDALTTRAALEIETADLTSFVRATFAVAPRYVPSLRGLMAEAQLDPGFGERFVDQFLGSRRAVLMDLVGRELPDVDPEHAADVVFGTLWYLVLTRPASLTAAYGDRVLALLRSLGRV